MVKINKLIYAIINKFFYYLNKAINIYHVILLNILWKFKSSNEYAERWIFISNNTSNIDINAGKALITYFLSKLGIHGELLFSGRKNFFFYSKKTFLSDFEVKNRFFVKNTGEKSISLDDLVIDLEEKKILYENINFFDLIDTTLSNVFLSYKPNYKNKLVVEQFNKLLESIVSTLEICKKIEVMIHEKKITLLLSDTVSVPNAVFILYFYKYAIKGLINIYSFGYSYRTYHNKGEIHGSTYMMSKCNQEYFHYYHANHNDFNKWFNKNGRKEKSRINDFCKNIFFSDHNNKYFQKIKKHTVLINEAKKNKTPIYCLFAHLSYDRPVYDRTDCFEDMYDWIKKTIEILSNQNCLLLIKPHIMEYFLIDSKKPKEFLRDIIDKDSLAKNIILLEPNEYKSTEIFKFIDTSIIWRSTAYIESIYFNKPAIYCGPTSSYSDVINDNYLDGVESYAKILKDSHKITVRSSYRDKALSVLYYLNNVLVKEIDIFDKLPKPFGQNIIINPVKLFKLIFFNKKFESDFIKQLNK